MEAPIELADFGKTANDYLTHRAGFPETLFKRVFESWQLGAPEQSILDMGTGTGTLGRGFAKQGCSVIGIDPSNEMLEAARIIDASFGLETDYALASAEKTDLPDHSFDVVSAGQCWHWFDAALAGREIKRLLKPKGYLLIAYYDWLPLEGNVVRRSEEIVERFNPAWKAGNLTGIHPGIFRDLGEAGFGNIESFTYDEAASYTHESWRGRIRASAGVAASMPAEMVEKLDAEHAQMLRTEFPEEQMPDGIMQVPHRVFAVKATVLD